MVHDFPQYKERKVINRQVKNTIIPDILILGLTITNNIPAKDLDKIFQSPNKLSESASLTPDSKAEVVEKQLEDLASLLQIMLELRGRVDKLETEVRTIQGKEVTDVQQLQPIETDMTDAQNNSAHQASRAIRKPGNQLARVQDQLLQLEPMVFLIPQSVVRPVHAMIAVIRLVMRGSNCTESTSVT